MHWITLLRILSMTGLAAAFAGSAQAGKVADTLREGVFGIPWGATRSDIQAKFPEGVTTDTGQFVVRSSRPMLNRPEPKLLRFTLDQDGKLSRVFIEFPVETGPALIDEMAAVFGAVPSATRDKFSGVPRENQSSATYEWSADEGITLSLNCTRLVMTSLKIQNCTLGIDGRGAGTKSGNGTLGF
jgi:hypothetical protein